MKPAPKVADLGRIKGFAFSEFLNWYESKYGREKVSGAVAAADVRHGVEFDQRRPSFGILASDWYDAAIVHTVLDELTRGHSPAELDAMAVEAAAVIMGRTLRGIYRAVFSLAVTPARYAQHVDKAWRLHYDSGYPLISAPNPKEHRVTYRDWRSHHPMICRLNMGAAGPIYGAMGCKNLRFRRLSCISDGGEQCASVIQWE